MTKKYPLGVIPYIQWFESVDFDPTLEQLLDRYEQVCAAVSCYRAIRKEPLQSWLIEIGVINSRGDKLL